MGPKSSPGEFADGARAEEYRGLVEHIQDAVVEFELADGEPVVRDVNEAFVDVFGYAAGDIRGGRLNEWIVPAWLGEEASALDERTASGEVNYRRVKRETSDGLREFLYRGIPSRTAGAVDGFAVYTDLTDITRTESRLRVMNRVLRHNLRNRTNVIAGYAARLLDEFDEQRAERTEAAATVERAVADLEGLAEEAADVQAILSAPVADETVDAATVARRAAARRRDRSPAASVETALPESAPVSANRHLETALDALLDNAVRHNPAAEPRVRVSVTRAASGDWVNVDVADDGPPIPENDRRVVAGDAEVTSTRHASGLGLWLVKWTTERVGGDLSFGTSDLGGNRVRLRLLGA